MPSTAIAPSETKKKKIKSSTASAQPNALPVAKPIEGFPRGGALALSPLEMRDVADKAEKDVLFQVSIQHF